MRTTEPKPGATSTRVARRPGWTVKVSAATGIAAGVGLPRVPW